MHIESTALQKLLRRRPEQGFIVNDKYTSFAIHRR